MNQAVSFLAAASDHPAAQSVEGVSNQPGFPASFSSFPSGQMECQLPGLRSQDQQNLSEQRREAVSDTQGGGQDMSLKVPDEIWQHILSFLPPTALGRMLSVNRRLNQLLMVDKPQNSQADETSSSRGILKPLSSSDVWSLSRKLYHHDWPDPLYPFDEYSMCKFIFRKQCASCNSKTREDAASGCVVRNDGVSILWPFATQMCTSCFAAHSQNVCSVFIIVLLLVLIHYCYRNLISCSLLACHQYSYLALLLRTSLTK